MNFVGFYWGTKLCDAIGEQNVMYILMYHTWFTYNSKQKVKKMY